MKHQDAQTACHFCCTRIEDLGVQTDRHTLLHDINLHIHCGELTALIGPNGAGKTTLLRALLGLIPYTGKVTFDQAAGGPPRKPRIGYVPQVMDLDRLAPVSVEDLFACACNGRPAFLGLDQHARAQAEQSLARTGAQDLIKKRLGTLSGGEMQRVLLALALTPLPDVLLLDEPVSGVDARGIEAFYSTVDEVRAACDLTCLLVCHDLGAVRRHADRVVLLRGTILDAGSPDDVFAGDAFRAVFGFGGEGA